MKTFISVFFLLILFLTGCGSTKIGKEYEFSKLNTVVDSNIGYLKIYTIEYKEKGDFADDLEYNVFKGYTIYTRNGNYVRDGKKSFRNPELVRLKESEYIIVAESHKNIIHSFQVEIERGKIIEVDKSILENQFSVSQIY